MYAFIAAQMEGRTREPDRRRRDPARHDLPHTYADAVDAYLRSAGITASSQRIYRISLTTWAWLAHGEQPPLGRARRDTTPPAVPFSTLDGPAAAGVLAETFAQRAWLVDADTVNQELSALTSARACAARSPRPASRRPSTCVGRSAA